MTVNVTPGADFAMPPFSCARGRSNSGSAWVAVTGELDLASAPQLEGELRGAQRDASLVVLDLRRLAFTDCAGMNVVVEAAVRAREHGSRLVVVRGGPRIDLVLTLTKSSRFLEIVDLDPEDRLEEALRWLTRQSGAAARPPPRPALGRPRLGIVGGRG
ncbi:MAG: hypothetical protein NVSMB25_11700 [Thermoleophilaceae bacterium]